MLYPKKFKNKNQKKIIVKIDYLKEKIISFFKIFKNFNSFILFIKQKLHF